MRRITVPLKITALFFIVLLFFALRVHTFYLSHINNDELIYLGLALKIDQSGFKVFDGHYNIYNLDLKIGKNFVGIKPSGERLGTLAQLLRVDEGVETQQLSHHPPLLSLLLAASHRIFMPNHAYISSFRRINANAVFLQWYCGSIPFFASLLTVFLVYLLGKAFFCQRVGLFAAFLLVVTPTDMLTAQKIWADNLVTLCILLSVYAYWLSLKKNSAVLAVLSGVCAWLAIVTKQSGILTVPLVLVLHHFFYFKAGFSLFARLAERKLLLFLFVCALLTAGWATIYVRQNGLAALWLQYTSQFAAKVMYPTDFIRFVNTRPWFTHLLTIPFQQPLFIFTYATFLYVIKDKAFRRQLCFLCFWFLVFLISATLMQGKEERYLLPAYPAITLLASYSVIRIWDSFGARTGRLPVLLRCALIILLCIASFQAITIGLSAVFSRVSLIPIPA
ncbi:MAG: glycosyltransferase family 39 protein [Candidatus Omnitrophota bacterium]